MYLLIALGIALVAFIYLVALPYFRCYLIARRYPQQSRIHFVPLLGTIFTQLQSEAKGKDPLLFYFETRKPDQKFIVSNLLTRPFIMLQDEILAKQFLLNQNQFIKYSKFLFGQYYFSKNIISQNGEEWQRQKKIMSKAINFQFIAKLVPHIQSIAKSKIVKIESGKPLSSQNLIFEHNAESISVSFFSQNLAEVKVKDQNLVSELTRVINYCIDRSGQLYTMLRLNILPFSSVNWGFILTKTQKQVLADFKTLKGILKQKVNQRIEKLKKDGNTQGDFLSYYLELYTDPNNKSIEMEQILQQFDSLLVAGSDTGAVLGGMCIYCLAKYPEWYNRLQKICNDLPQQLNIEAVNRNQQLTYFIKQVSRFYPPAPFLFPRTNQKAVKLGQYQFPAGCYFTPGIKVIMNDPKVFQNPNEFNPERWEKLSGRIWSYLTFSGGPRSCLGEKLAMTNLKILLIQFIRRFKVELNPKVELVMAMKTLYQPKQENLVIPKLKEEVSRK